MAKKQKEQSSDRSKASGKLGAQKADPLGLTKLKSWEGLRLKAYKDSVGVWTIGYGHTSSAGSPVVKEGLVITEEEAEKILLKDLKVFEKAVKESVTVPLNENQYWTLVSFCYNVGETRFKSSTLVKKLNKGEYSEVPKELMKWVYGTENGVKVKIKGLVNRRASECGLWSIGEFVHGNDVSASTAPSRGWKEVLTSTVTSLSGLSAIFIGEGPVQYALAGAIVVFGLSYLYYFHKRKGE